MSINRPKRANRRQEPQSSSKLATSSDSKKVPKWKDAVGEQPDAAFVPYDTAATFAKDTLVAHPKFGKGLVVEVDGNKVQILFEGGVRKLMHATPG